KEGVYSYGGRMGQPDPKFINGDCAMLIQSSAVIGGFKKSLKFEWGTGQLPHWGAPYKKQNTIVGGGTLWVMKGHKSADDKGVALFMRFIAEPHQQMWWSVTTGYVPVTQTAIKNLEAGYHFKKNPEQWTALSQLSAKPTPNSLGHRLENFRKLLTSSEYYSSIVNSFLFAFGVTAIGLGAGRLVAALATQKIRGLAAYRTAVLWPYGIAPPIAGIIFLFIFHPSYGALPY